MARHKLNIDNLTVETFNISGEYEQFTPTVVQPASECCSPLCVTDTSPCCCN